MSAKLYGSKDLVQCSDSNSLDWARIRHEGKVTLILPPHVGN